MSYRGCNVNLSILIRLTVRVLAHLALIPTLVKIVNAAFTIIVVEKDKICNVLFGTTSDR